MFDQLSKINVSDKIERKNNLSYLSWAWAWGELKKISPDAFYTVYETDTGCIYWNDGKTAWVKTGVTTVAEDGNQLEHIEYLPVMDYRNKSITLEAITSTDVNKTIQRSLTKAIARHGLGLYIYAGEDLPEGEPAKPINPESYKFQGGKFKGRTLADVADELGNQELYGYRDWMSGQDKVSGNMQECIDVINLYEANYG